MAVAASRTDAGRDLVEGAREAAEAAEALLADATLAVRRRVARDGKIAAGLITVALFVSHKWLPAGHRRLREVVVGILATLALWLIAGILFGRYLEAFASNYVTYYAGLASVVIALVFLYWSASIFVFGAELNSAITLLSSPP